MPCISLIVLSYNQESMVIRCLNSILSSYTKDIELIITDDCSSDNTVIVIDKWISKQREKFEKIIFIKNTSNLGTVNNLIKAVNMTHADYIKGIAGDDWFLPNALDNIRLFCSQHKFDVAFSAVQIAYQDKNGNLKVSNEFLPASKINGFFEMTIKKQFSYIVRNNCLRSPGCFFTRDYWNKIKLYEEKIRVVEDWAMWMKGISLNMKFVEMEIPIVVYRQTCFSVSNNVYSPIYKEYLSDNAWILRNIGFSRMEWLSALEILRLASLWSVVKIVSMLPLYCISFLEKKRKNI